MVQVLNVLFEWEVEVEINLEVNIVFEGFYMLNGMYCIQCEVEGFCKIIYYFDCFDVMSVFIVWIEGGELVFLFNGNLIVKGDGFVEWYDLWLKLVYLFVFVVGDLIVYFDWFIIKLGKDVELNIYVCFGDEDKCVFGMQVLKNLMIWDENVYGCEYDFDIFNIVVVDDFNMGVMENKGLNIFNLFCVFVSFEISIDVNFEWIEGIIVYEYFYNWIGNCIICCDWFQFCFKEGLIVYCDQMFLGDMCSYVVKWIEEVLMLCGCQFCEDNGFFVYNVCFESFVEINNFYIVMVYEKGVEIIGMLCCLIGDKVYYKGCDLYFICYDSQVVMIEDWLVCFVEVIGCDLIQFKCWYIQVGILCLILWEEWDNGILCLMFM